MLAQWQEPAPPPVPEPVVTAPSRREKPLAEPQGLQTMPQPQRLTASAKRLDLGTLSPGRGATAELEVQGGPGQVVVESDQVDSSNEQTMPAPLLTTKLYAPPPRPNRVHRRRLLERLDDGLHPGQRLILIAAPASYGKTTLLSE